MKRLMLLAIAGIVLGGTTFAKTTQESKEYAVFSKLNNQEKFDGLAKYLNADMSQKEYLSEIFALSLRKMEREMSKQTVSEVGMEKAIAFNLANAKSVLTPEQYRKYLTVLNVTLNNSQEEQLFVEK